MAEDEPVRKGNRRFGKKSSGQWLLFAGDCKLLGDALAAKPSTSGWVLLQFLDALLRGYGQMVFCNNPITGLLFAIGITVADPAVSLTGLVAGTVGLLVSVVSQQSAGVIRAGLTVYNPLLLGLVTASIMPTMYGLEMNSRHWIFLITGVVFCVYIASAVSSLLGSIGRHPLPFLTVPFVTIQMMIFLCVIIAPARNGVGPSGDLGAGNTPLFLGDNETVTAGTKERRGENIAFVTRSTSKDVIDLEGRHENGSPEMFIALSVNDSEVQATTDGARNSSTRVHLGAAPEAGMSKIGIGRRTEGSNTSEPGTLASDALQEKMTTPNATQEKTLTQEMRDPYTVDWGQVFTGAVLSITQACGICNAPVAVFMFLGVVICSPLTASFYFLGAIIGTLTGLLFCPAPYTAVYQGIWGFNGMLCAGALGGFWFVITWQSAVLALVCAGFASCLQNVLNPLFASVPMPILSVPFNISALLFLCASAEGDSALVRPAVLSFAEKHRHDFGRKLKKKREQLHSSGSISIENNGDQEKRLPVEEV